MFLANFFIIKTKNFIQLILFIALIVLSYHEGAAQEKCNQDAVQNILQIWTHDATGECSPQTLNKLIDFYENLQNKTITMKTKSICKQIIKNEARKTIVDKVSNLLRGPLNPPQNRVIVENLLKRIDQRDGLLSSAIDMAYWSLGASARQELANKLLILSDSEVKVHALLEFERLAKSSEDSQFKSIKKYLSNTGEKTSPYSETIKQALKMRNQHEKCEESLNHCINAKLQRTYPPPELNTTMQAVTALRYKCQPLHLERNLEKLEHEVAHTWRHCTVKLKNVINMKSKNMSGHLIKLNVPLRLIDEGCTSPGKTENVEEQIGKFEKALHTLKYLC